MISEDTTLEKDMDVDMDIKHYTYSIIFRTRVNGDDDIVWYEIVGKRRLGVCEVDERHLGSEKFSPTHDNTNRT